MNSAWGLRQQAQALVAAVDGQDGLPPHWSERARALVVARTALRLIRQRPIATALAGHLRPPATRFGTMAAKFSLWAALGQARRSIPQRHAPDSRTLIRSLAATDAWRMARHRHQFNPLTPMPRLHDGATVTRVLRQQQPRLIAFWHHHDRLGELPRSWLAVLAQLRQRNWLVVVSSSFLNPKALADLKRHDLLPCRRDNIGLCLGAYKDFCLLLHDLELQPQALLLSNDSTLPLRPDGLMEALEDLAGQSEQATTPLLGGFTDSVERGAYHLQSYWLEANGPLLASQIWHQFWRRMPIAGGKDSLIDAGEIGLSQALLQAGVDLQARFPLLQSLLHEPAMARDLKRAGIRTPLELNQSLQAWRSLLARDFPLVKKRVLFEGADNMPAPPVLTELIGALPPGFGSEALSLLEDDLQALLRSRHTGADQGQRADHEPLAQGR